MCSNNYAAMYNLVCYLNSTSTVHWFLSLCLQLHTECNGCSNYRLLVFCPQHTYKCKDLSTYYYSNKQLLCFPFTGGFKCVPLKNALIVRELSWGFYHILESPDFLMADLQVILPMQSCNITFSNINVFDC